ncbi:MAG: carboxypeptidase regulatory-like domain-containing protein, partial [Planctomycetes bacterium]|nr:carboxypeptidase regulatory-like domain-containing protein [Planctomycetota bacterium]
MSEHGARRRPYRRSSWIAGLLVLGGLAWTLMTLVEVQRLKRVTASMPEAPRVRADAAADAGAPAVNTMLEVPPVRRLGGVVRLPSGAPASGATVTAYQAVTAGPEWRTEYIDQAFTGDSGEFFFDLPVRHGLLIEFKHPEHAGGMLEVPELRDLLELDLQPGFEFGGLVTNDAGQPLGGVRVAAESTIDQQRRVAVAVTTTSGGYRFTNLPAGLIRLVARHERWQAMATTVRVGETKQQTIRFATAAAAPLRGRIVTTGQVPIGGALVELLPTNGRLGLVDPVTARTGDDGRFVLSGLSRGPMSLLVRHDDFGVQRRTVSVGASPAEIVLELPPRSEVHGSLLAAAGGAPTVAEVTVRITDAAGEIRYATTDAEGRFTFARPLSPGRATVALLDGAVAFQRSQSFELSAYV